MPCPAPLHIGHTACFPCDSFARDCDANALTGPTCNETEIVTSAFPYPGVTRTHHARRDRVLYRIKADFVLVSANGVNLERQNASAAKKIIKTSSRPLTLVVRDTSIVSNMATFGFHRHR